MKKILIIAGILIVIGGIIFLVRQRQQKTTKESSTTIQRGTLTVSLTLSGEIQAKERYAARFQTTGMVTGVYAKEGDTVKKYQTLATLDQRRLKNEMEQLLKQYMNTRWTFDQTKDDQKTTADLAPQQAVRERAKRLIDQAQFSLDRSVLAVEAQALALEFSVLKSPIDGIIVQAPKVTAGMNIT
ncbi:MAG: efflux RND transporter periplasmic adaptor subunit, partial [Patescibacteria group bacterium]|nr:efflux RND transporter periplasmic adaptor subunit [Patescibacteria group bacterium]